MKQFNIQQAQKLQAQLLKAQAELANVKVEGSAGGGAVKVIMNGQQQVESVKISKEVVNPEEIDMLEDLVLSAIRDASTKSQEAAAKQMSALTGGLKIPGLM